MLKSLLIILLLSMALVAANNSAPRCFQTHCHTLFVNRCPSGTETKTWNSCGFLMLGKYETCCHVETNPVPNPRIIPNTEVEMPRPVQNTYKQQAYTTTTAMARHPHSQQIDRSPLISELTWGRIIVQGIDQQFKDVKLFPGGAVAWDWRKTGTRHEPGTQPADLEELFENHCEIIILSRGIENRLKTTEETRNLLEQRGMKLNQNYFILQSEEARDRYNQLAAQNKRVCAIIHSTC